MKPDWNKRFTFEYGIGIVMTIAFVLIVVTGVFTFQRFSGIVSRLNNASTAETQLLKAEILFNELTDADNNVKSFTLTQDSIYLDNFYENVSMASEKVRELEAIQENNDQFNVRIKRLDYLMEQKFILLQDLLYLEDPNRVGLALSRVQNEIAGTESSSSNIFEKLFKRSNRSAKAVKNTIAGVKKQEEVLAAERRAQELALFNRDTEITSQIRDMVDAIQESSLQMAASRSEAAAEDVRSTNQQLLLFCILSGVILLVMAYIIASYISNNRNYRLALQDAKKQSEELSKARSQFLANMSHEIRTPLNAIVGFADQLAVSPMEKSQKEDVVMIQKSADHLLYIINDILDVTKLQAGKMQLEKTAFQPREVLDEVLQLVDHASKKKQLKVLYDWSPEIPEMLKGDPYRLRQIMLNLINNSIKFTTKGTITVKCKVRLQDKRKTVFCLDVIDTGIGMTPEQLKKIFNEFEQAELSTTRNYGGSGLGLSIVKMLVRLHGGDINVTSKKGKGTTISVEIPYMVAKPKRTTVLKKVPSETEKAKLEGQRILVVDDEAFNRKLLQRILEKHDAVVTEVENGLEALKEVERNVYDMVLMDMRMPVMDGMEATRKIRKNKNMKLRSLPIIALTAATTSEEKARVEALGINGFLAKPFKEEALLKHMRQVQNKNRFKSFNKEKMSPSASQQLSFEYLKSTSPREDAFYQEMLHLFIKGLEEGLVEMKAAGEQKNWEGVADLAHRMSTPCKHLEATKLYGLLKEMEAWGRSNQLADKYEAAFAEVETLANDAISQVRDEIEEVQNI